LVANKTANIHNKFERLPQGYNTKIGQEGLGLSGGQRQRILIARAFYKDPDFLFSTKRHTCWMLTMKNHPK
jgi:ATP-binding cassette subfamily B protein